MLPDVGLNLVGFIQLFVATFGTIVGVCIAAWFVFRMIKVGLRWCRLVGADSPSVSSSSSFAGFDEKKYNESRSKFINEWGNELYGNEFASYYDRMKAAGYNDEDVYRELERDYFSRPDPSQAGEMEPEEYEAYMDEMAEQNQEIQDQREWEAHERYLAQVDSIRGERV